MNTSRIDRISRSLAKGRIANPAPERDVLATGATTVPEADAEHGPQMLFVQTFQGGTIESKEGSEGRYTLTLEAGTGQTVYFSNRPDRVVGASPTPQFLKGLSFPDDNPPNAALVVETAPGERDIAVVELFNPMYDPESQGVTYEMEVLANWQRELDLDFQEAPVDLATLAPSFGAAQLFIDDCFTIGVTCYLASDRRYGADSRQFSHESHDGHCYSWRAVTCLPCQPWFGSAGDATVYWTAACNTQFPDFCQGNCTPVGVDSGDWCSFAGAMACGVAG